MLTQSRITCAILHIRPESLGEKPPPEKKMKNRSLFALVGLAISFALPAFAHKKIQKPDPQKANGLSPSLNRIPRHSNKNDAAADGGTVYTEDGVNLEQEDRSFGREAIQKLFAGMFQRWQSSKNSCDGQQDIPPTYRYGMENRVGTGEWSEPGKEKDGRPDGLRATGRAVEIREGEHWKIRLLTNNVTPEPAK